MNHKMHFWDDTAIWVEATKLSVVVTYQPCQVSSLILSDSGAEQSINYVHHPQKVIPALIILWNIVAHQKR